MLDIFKLVPSKKNNSGKDFNCTELPHAICKLETCTRLVRRRLIALNQTLEKRFRKVNRDEYSIHPRNRSFYLLHGVAITKHGKESKQVKRVSLLFTIY